MSRVAQLLCWLVGFLLGFSLSGELVMGGVYAVLGSLALRVWVLIPTKLRPRAWLHGLAKLRRKPGC